MLILSLLQPRLLHLHNGIIRWFIKKEKQQGSLLALYPHREYDTSLSENLTALAVTGTPVRGTL
jgi:hypothetical protein